MVQDVVDLNAQLHARAVVLKSIATAGLARDRRIDGKVTAGRNITWATWRGIRRAARCSTGARRESTRRKSTSRKTTTAGRPAGAAALDSEGPSEPRISTLLSSSFRNTLQIPTDGPALQH